MLAPACYPLTGPECIVNAKLILAMLRDGWEVDVLSFRHKGTFYPAAAEGHWQAVEQRMIYSPAELGRRSFGRLWAEAWGSLGTGYAMLGAGWAHWAVKQGIRMLRRRNYDVLMSRSWPGFLAGMILARSSGCPWIANWNDPWPQAAYPPPYGRGNHSARPAQRRLLREVVARARWHSFPCAALREHMLPLMGQSVLERSSIIPHAGMVLPEGGRPQSRSETFRLCHAGTFDRVRSPDVFLEGFAKFLRLTRSGSRVELKLIGDGNTAAQTIARLGLSGHVIDVGRMSYDRSLSAMADSDVLVILEAQFPKGVFLPSKFVDYVQVGRPILAVSPAVGALADLLNVHGAGLAADNTSSDAIAAAIDTLYRSWQAGQLEQRYSSAHLQSLYNAETILNLHRQMFRSAGIGGTA
jgi:glycosyltransferase involved in cell wall biosynthesis